MILEGTFKDITNNNTYYVKIGNVGATKPIQDNDDTTLSPNIICFSTNPVVLNSDMSDTFSNVYIRECTITLTTNYDINEIITAKNYTDIPVEVRHNNANGTVIFSGFVVPLNYNQRFANKWNNVELNCIDRLGILQYIQFPTVYSKYETSMEYIKPREVLDWCLAECGFDNSDVMNPQIMYDIDNDMTNATKINPGIFFGESQDDWKMCDEVLNELGRLYGFWIWQDGDICYVRNRIFNTRGTSKTITKDDYAGSDMNLSIDQAFNQIKMTCNIETPDNTIFDPFDDNYLTNVFPQRQRYMREHICPGEGNTAWNAFNNVLSDLLPLYDALETKDHYFQVKKNDAFDFGEHGYMNDGINLNDQRYTLQWLNNNPGKAAFVSFGHTSNLTNYKDTSPVKDFTLSDYLVISVKGRYEGGIARQQDKNPSNVLDGTRMEAQLQANIPLCTANVDAVYNYTPMDDTSTNYIVFSGNILLNPLQPKTGPKYSTSEYAAMGEKWSSYGTYKKSTNTIQDCINAQNQMTGIPVNNIFWTDDNTLFKRTVPASSNGDGAYYQHRYYTGDGDGDYNKSLQLMHGPLDNDKNKILKYDYSSDGTFDNIHKLSILCCQMKIGDKYCVERLDLGAAGENRFEWLTESELPHIDGDVIDYFTLGIDPAIGETIVGQSKEISRNYPATELDASGTAIPINFSDHLNGKFEFKILGPYNLMYDEITKKTHRKWIFWKYTTTSTKTVPVLECLENILISNFKIELISDQSNESQNNDNDLVYVSQSNSTYYESQEMDSDFCTALTTSEAQSKGIDFALTNSAILDLNNDPFYGFDYVDNEGTVHEGTKLEEARVYEQYQRWKEPHEIAEVTLKMDNNPEYALPHNIFKFNYLANNFEPIANEVNLWMHTQKVKMRDIR